MSYPELTLAGERKLPRILTGVFRVGLHRYTLLAGLLLAFVGLVTLLAPTDPDVWWHLRNGQLILDSGVPHTDVFSFTAYGRIWIVHEWLAEVVMYVVKSALGYGVLSLLFGVFQAAGGLVVYLLVRRAGAGRLTALLLLMVYLVFASPSWGVRVQVVDPMFLGVFYLILLSYRANPTRQRILWIPPLLIALWTNLHASYSAGLALIAVFAAGEFANNWLYRPARPTPVRPLLMSLVACLAATLINPYFIELWTYPLTYVLNGMSNPLLKYIQEWQSPNFHEPQSLLFAATFILVAIIGIARPAPESETYGWRLGLTRRVDITTTILFAAFTVIALQAMRFIPVYGVIVLPILAGALSDTWPALSNKNETAPSPVEGRVNWVVGGAAIVLAAIMMWNMPNAQTGSEPRTQTLFTFPVRATDYISTLPASTRMYNDFGMGGYLIYRLYPQHKVFIDGRGDMFRVGVFEDSITIEGANPGWSKALDAYQINTAVTTSGGPLDAALSQNKIWSVAYRDNFAVVYRRSNSPTR